MPSKSRIHGFRQTKKLIRNIDAAARAEISDVLEYTGPRLQNLIKLRTPVRTGALSRGIKYRVLKKSLSLKVGVLGSPKNRGKLFYGYILNFGRKGGPAKANRKTKSGRSNYTVNVKRLPASKFVTGAGRFIRPELQPHLDFVWDRILRRASRGTGDD